MEGAVRVDASESACSGHPYFFNFETVLTIALEPSFPPPFHLYHMPCTLQHWRCTLVILLYLLPPPMTNCTVLFVHSSAFLSLLYRPPSSLFFSGSSSRYSLFLSLSISFSFSLFALLN